MKHPLTVALAALTCTISVAHAGEPDKKIVVPPVEDRWKLTLAVPGWMAGVDGTVGIDGVDSHVDLRMKNLINKIDMVWATRAELSKGRFGVMSELVYASLSDSLGVGGPVQKIDVRVDQYLADFTLRWRVLEGEKGFVDVLAGVRYSNLFQHLHLQSDDKAIAETSEQMVDEVGHRLRERIDEVFDKKRFQNGLVNVLRQRLAAVGKTVSAHFIDDLQRMTGPDPRRRALPNAALAYRHVQRLGSDIESLVHGETAKLLQETEATIRAAVAAEREEIGAATEAARTAARMRAASLRNSVNKQIAKTKQDLEQKIQDRLHNGLNESFTRYDDWWDPYVGLRGRYNFTHLLYFVLRGDIGGFGVGSDLMWQFEGAFGIKLTERVFAEAGYRALSFDYHKNGLTYDVVTKGAQITVGLEF